MTLLWLPDLERDEHDRANPWSEHTDPKGCLHTTEGTGWPGYNGWTIMPHGTIMPIPGKGIRGKQHLPLSHGAFALRNLSGGVETNRDYVFQFELIGTCEKNGDAYKAGAYYWPDADDAVLADLYRKVIKPLSDAVGIPVRSRPWQAYPASYGARSGTNNVRMSGDDFDTWSGWLGHQHVPENVHGDPGLFPWDRMIAAITPPPKEEHVTISQKDFDDLLKLEVTLSTQTQVDAWNSIESNPAKRKAVGDTFTLGTYVVWGAAGQARDVAEGRAAAAAQAATNALILGKLTALSDAVAAIAQAAPDAVTAAFTAGLARFDTEIDAKFDALDVHITVGDDTPAPPA